MGSRIKYEKLNVGSKRGAVNTSWCIKALIIVAICLINFSLGYSARGFRQPRSTAPGDLHLQDVERIFKYNRTFAERPSESSEAAWNELFPRQGGFFRHPDTGSIRSAFSVFHQLHCLNGLRHGYWLLYDIASGNSNMTVGDMPLMRSPPHMRHCIDLLRQTLMCKPDLTIEVKDEAAGGVKGFETSHTCRDWNQLLDWTANWESYSPDKQHE